MTSTCPVPQVGHRSDLRNFSGAGWARVALSDSAAACAQVYAFCWLDMSHASISVCLAP
jgi:hypothetical protein